MIEREDLIGLTALAIFPVHWNLNYCQHSYITAVFIQLTHSDGLFYMDISDHHSSVAPLQIILHFFIRISVYKNKYTPSFDWLVGLLLRYSRLEC